jgi:hypothetical protein
MALHLNAAPAGPFYFSLELWRCVINAIWHCRKRERLKMKSSESAQGKMLLQQAFDASSAPGDYLGRGFIFVHQTHDRLPG